IQSATPEPSSSTSNSHPSILIFFIWGDQRKRLLGFGFAEPGLQLLNLLLHLDQHQKKDGFHRLGRGCLHGCADAPPRALAKCVEVLAVLGPERAPKLLEPRLLLGKHDAERCHCSAHKLTSVAVFPSQRSARAGGSSASPACMSARR